ncbi:MAG: hypothetical protein MUF07_00965 [Steroidobacteraceae bacterium]|nr:hypothetical protein [Steroidobacteraceae bacterium]
MALAKPSAPELARYTFFVSRRREEGRERFRLHMGYFATRDEAEQMLALVRDLYPAAWVGETPGRKLPAVGRGATAAAAAPPSDLPVEPAAPAAARPAAASPAATATSQPPASGAATPTPAPAPAPAPATATAAPLPTTAPAAPAAAAPRKPGPGRSPVPPASNVREVIAALEPDGDTAASGTVQMPIPPPSVTAATRTAGVAARPATHGLAAPAKPRAPAAPAAPSAAARPGGAPRPGSAAKPPAAASTPGARTPPATPAAAQPAAVPAVQSTSPGAEMTDSQVLRVLEGPGTAGSRAAPPAGVRDIALLSPQDTQTWRDIKAQIKREAVVHFAVQLNWAVTPIDLARVPSLAIFNAYTLYKIEGNREGRKWYGLRLGFFSDAMSAKQVAHYVRSEFAQVAVVPVSVNEREQARQIGAIALPPAAPASRAGGPASDEFKLIDDEPATAAPRPEEIELSTPAPAPAAAVAPTRPVAASPAAHAPAATSRRPNRPRGAPQSLEETLEILGASQLSIDTGRGERVVIDGRARAVDPPTSTFSRLLDRLGEKLRK